MNKFIEFIRNRINPEIINYIFLGFLLLFLIDNIYNTAVKHAPILVAGAIFLSLFFLAYLINDYKKHMWLLTGITLMFLIMIVNSFKDGFHVRNISDLLFFVMYILSYLAFFSAQKHLKLINAQVFIVSTVLLFIVPLTLSLFGLIHPHRVGYSFKSGEISHVQVLNDADNKYLASLNLSSSQSDYTTEKEVYTISRFTIINWRSYNCF
ncbi:MAG: hypothetical protein CVT98_04510 [Bacteroidetes bacterium HGW-Bacteroidetes-15]|nr:MAG: hypothetical protein CVT98_04510 [Bacteroidetes bacterium HGW-Bacteroidetes-15]